MWKVQPHIGVNQGGQQQRPPPCLGVTVRFLRFWVHFLSDTYPNVSCIAACILHVEAIGLYPDLSVCIPSRYIRIICIWHFVIS